LIVDVWINNNFDPVKIAQARMDFNELSIPIGKRGIGEVGDLRFELSEYNFSRFASDFSVKVLSICFG
jgi:hypothetical protein